MKSFLFIFAICLLLCLPTGKALAVTWDGDLNAISILSWEKVRDYHADYTFQIDNVDWKRVKGETRKIMRIVRKNPNPEAEIKEVDIGYEITRQLEPIPFCYFYVKDGVKYEFEYDWFKERIILVSPLD